MSKKESKARFGMTISPEVFEELEERRGLIPRSTYIEHCLTQYFKFQDSATEFYDGLLEFLPEDLGQVDCDNLRNLLDAVRSKIEKRKSVIQP